MACYSPLTGYQRRPGAALSFTPPRRGEILGKKLQVSCGQCIGCRLERSRQWAVRCVHESQLHADNCFITLTYNDENLPEHGTLYKPHLQKFFKRLRKHRGPFRYYACGEYGDTTQRAHYHACIFGLNFNDRIHFRKIGEHSLYISEELTQIWGHGNTSIGELTFETAAYTARYVTKKLSKGQNRYVSLDEETGELRPLVQPFAVMSLREAIAKRWLQENHADIYANNKDAIRIRGMAHKPTRYYDKLYDSINPAHMAEIKELRVENHTPTTPTILRARAKNARARIYDRKQI